MLQFESRGVGGDLVNTASFVPNGTNPPSRRVVIWVNSGASKTSRALLKLGLNAQELRRAAAQLLQQGGLGLPVGKNLPIGLRRRQVLALEYEPMFGVPIKLRRGGPSGAGASGQNMRWGAGAGQSGSTLGV